jgi:hypothetical protein
MSAEIPAEPQKHPRRHATQDPLSIALREHTQLEMLAARMKQLASEVERGEHTSGKLLREGLAVYRQFVVELHQAREAVLLEAARGATPPPDRALFAKCEAAHPMAAKFVAESEAILARPGLAASDAKSLAARWTREADRLLEHHRTEEEPVYRHWRATLDEARKAELFRAMAKLHAIEGPAASRLSAWVSRENPSSD